MPDVSKIPRTTICVRGVSIWMHDPHRFHSLVRRFGSDPLEQWWPSFFSWWHFISVLCNFPIPPGAFHWILDQIINNLKYVVKHWWERNSILEGKWVILVEKQKCFSPYFSAPLSNLSLDTSPGTLILLDGRGSLEPRPSVGSIHQWTGLLCKMVVL